LSKLTSNKNLSMNAIIIDDEADARENLGNLLEKYCSDVNIVGQADSTISGIEEINKHQIDLVFLDIQMPDGSGLDLLEKLQDISFEIYFRNGLTMNMRSKRSNLPLLIIFSNQSISWS